MAAGPVHGPRSRAWTPLGPLLQARRRPADTATDPIGGMRADVVALLPARSDRHGPADRRKPSCARRPPVPPYLAPGGRARNPGLADRSAGAADRPAYDAGARRLSAG